MNKCLRILIYMDIREGFLKKIVQKYARKYNLEGMGQIIEEGVKIIICGKKNDVDNFLDEIHKELSRININNIIIEPFIKDKDYRGIFRTIE